MVEIYNGALNVEEILNSWYKKYSLKNYGAFITFVGIVRDENGIEGLSFDIYEPILNSWFKEWQKKVEEQDVVLLMAHSLGDVANHHSSYIAGVVSPKRRVALEIVDEFVEDFKQKAPIWKYDIVNGKRVYAKERSYKLPGFGLLK
ncbi:MAG: molybdenum cofactor biosynthesis protein MoaE [Campylobacteraceae bacterium]|jgi:molybdopterin synthase catalytic subunit|nr:molybdenum cofactor biosynthesis protein MoaE [Campylobacteraceae bacterium]